MLRIISFIHRHQTSLIGAALFFGILLIYMSLLPQDPAPGDGAGFTLAAMRLGQPHLPYPIHTLLAFVFTKLPWGTMAQKVSLLSAVAGAAAATLVYTIVCWSIQRRIGHRATRLMHISGLAAALLLAFSLSFWKMSSTAEVYTLNAALLAGTVLALLRWEQTCRSRFLFVGVLCYALSFGTHYLNIVYLPVLALFVLSSKRRAEIMNIRTISVIALLLLIGLAQFVYLPLRPIGPPKEITDLQAYWDFNLGSQVKEFLGNGASSEAPHVNIVTEFFGNKVRELTIAGCLMAAIGAITWLQRKRRDALFVLSLIALNHLSVLLLLDDPWATGSFSFFLLPSILLMAVLAGSCIYSVGEASRRFINSTTSHIALATLLAILAGFTFAGNRADLLGAKAAAEERGYYSRAVLSHLPRNAVILSDWEYATPLWYLQEADNLGRSVEVLSLWPHEWSGYISNAPPERPIYLTQAGSDITAGLSASEWLRFRWITAFRVVRESDYLVGPSVSPSIPVNISLSDKVSFLGYDLEGETLLPGQSLLIRYYWQCLTRLETDYTIYVHFLDSAGNIVFQQDHKPVGGAFPTSRWKPGDKVREEFVIVIPPEIEPGRYRIKIGLWDPSTGTQLKPVNTAEPIDAVYLNGFTAVSRPPKEK